jgi:hypothetical protein
MHQFLKYIYFDLTLYMFRTVFPSIIRSTRLYIQQQVYVKQILLPAAQVLLLATDTATWAAGRYCYLLQILLPGQQVAVSV